MSHHRVITDRASIIALKPDSVVLDYCGYILEKGWLGREWFTTDSLDRFRDDDIQLPARVLIESWER